MNEDIRNPLLSRNFQIYRSHYYKNVRPKFLSLKFLTQKTTSYTTNPKTLFYLLKKGNITSINKGKNIQMILTGEELQRKIEQITREI